MGVVPPSRAFPPHPVQPSFGRQMPCVYLMSSFVRACGSWDSLSEGAPHVSHERVRSGLLPLNSVSKKKAQTNSWQPTISARCSVSLMSTCVWGFAHRTSSSRKFRVSPMSTFARIATGSLSLEVTLWVAVNLSSLEPRSEARCRSL